MSSVRVSAIAIALLLLFSAPSSAQANCDPDKTQGSGSIYRICMPPAAAYNGMLVIWAHGFQDAGTPVGIPEDQLCLGEVCLPHLITSLGFAFATNSYSKTGLAIVHGKNDIADLAHIFALEKGPPSKIFLVGASEGGIITALSVEKSPELFAGGVAACGPVGNFRLNIDYFGDARATFEYFFPGVIPGDPFHPPPALVQGWNEYYENIVKPILLHPVNRARFNQWVQVANLPFDETDYLATAEVSAQDVLRYAVVNLTDAAEVLGGFPFDNETRRYSGSQNDVLLNLLVPRAAADPTALLEMRRDYLTSGVLERPLVTLHTLKDQQVPYLHEQIYMLKTRASGSFLTRHLNIPIDRFEHCNFTSDEALFAFLVVLFYDGVLQEVTGIGSYLSGARLAAFEARALAVGLPFTRQGARLALTLKQP
jgi:pimeloyl-ACP methyl ester carboxylesterase